MENQDKVLRLRSPEDLFVKPEQIAGSFFDPYTINFPLCFRGGLTGNSHLQVWNQVGLLRHSGSRIGIRKPEELQKQEDPRNLYGCPFYLFSSVSVSPRMVWFVQIADGVHSFPIVTVKVLNRYGLFFKTYLSYICFRMFSQLENSLSLSFRHKPRQKKAQENAPPFAPRIIFLLFCLP